jgi:hypothetical protein
MQTKLMFLPEDSLANPIQSQESDLVKKMTAISGQKCLERLEKLNHVGLWEKTFVGLLVGMEGWYSTKCKLTWKIKDMKYNRFLFQLQVSTLRTEGTEFGLLPTPTASAIGEQQSKNQIHISKDGVAKPIRESGIKGNSNLYATLQFRGMLPRPQASDFQPRWKTENWKGESDLPSVIKGINGTHSHLSPHFVMEMMGFPTDWTLLPFLNGERSHSKQEETQ